MPKFPPCEQLESVSGPVMMLAIVASLLAGEKIDFDTLAVAARSGKGRERERGGSGGGGGCEGGDSLLPGWLCPLYAAGRMSSSPTWLVVSLICW